MKLRISASVVWQVSCLMMPNKCGVPDKCGVAGFMPHLATLMQQALRA